MVPQTNDYNCGPFALSYFLSLHGKYYSPEDLEEVLHPTPELGTDPKAIELFLEGEDIPYVIKQWPFSALHSVNRPRNLPLLVNYNYETEGDHYSVVTEIDNDNNLTLFNPDTAELNYYSRQSWFNIWYSPLKKLKNWSLHLCLKETN